MFFIVGRGTEGGISPYHLSVAGLTYKGAEPDWGESEKVATNSGYSIGVMQIDLGQRGTWPLGATKNAPLRPGQTTYVDDLIAQAVTYAQEHRLAFTSDIKQLRADLLTHGDGVGQRSSLVFIDQETRDSINAWAASEGGQRWIHRNVDYPQIRKTTEIAFDLLEASGRNIPEDRRLETLAVLTKTANQRPSELVKFRQVLISGGDYSDVLAEADEIARHHRGYHGSAAAASAEHYRNGYGNPQIAAALDRAHAMVVRVDFNPTVASADPDIHMALRAVGQVAVTKVLREGSRGNGVIALQTDLSKLGITDDRGRVLRPDGAFGPSTREAVESFQRAHGLAADGRVGAKTLHALQEAVRPREASLADRSHPGFALFCQALEGVHLIDAKCGRTPDAWSDNLAGSLATAAHAQGLVRIDQVVLGENATRAFAVQEDPGSPFKRVAFVDVLPAIGKPLAQSSAEFRVMEPGMPRQAHEAASLQASAQPVLSDMQR
jgi:hypothetical protein